MKYTNDDNANKPYRTPLWVTLGVIIGLFIMLILMQSNPRNISAEYSYLHDRLECYNQLSTDQQVELIADIAAYNNRVELHGDVSDQIVFPRLEEQ